MQVFASLEDVPAGFGPSAVTIGKFDGVHLGHRAVLERLTRLADERGLTPAVVTFDRHPLSLLAPERCPEPLVSTDQKLELLAAARVPVTLVLPFTRELAGLAPEEFVDRVLVGAMGARAVLVGADFRFGAGGAGTVDVLRRLGEQRDLDVVLLPDVGAAAEEGDLAQRVSATLIRTHLLEGRPEVAARLLGRPHTVRSVVVRGAQRGRLLGYPTANLDPELEGLVPADGVYAAWLVVRGRRHAAAVSVGDNPTFEGVRAKQVEAYAIGQDFDIYGERVEVEFVRFLRPMVKFSGMDDLIVQMRLDVEQAAEVLAAPPGPAAPA